VGTYVGLKVDNVWPFLLLTNSLSMNNPRGCFHVSPLGALSVASMVLYRRTGVLHRGFTFTRTGGNREGRADRAGLAVVWLVRREKCHPGRIVVRDGSGIWIWMPPHLHEGRHGGACIQESYWRQIG
jgi:hypothetical protein